MALARFAADVVRDLLDSFRVVVVSGARQVGKSTLTRELLGIRSQYTFDDDATYGRAADDPTSFVESLPVPTVIDEYQRAGPALLRAVKQRVDHSNRRGQLLLTGSASYLASKEPVETLAGRAGRLELWPLSQGEQRGVRETFIERLFRPDQWPPENRQRVTRADAMDLVLRGGYPEVVTQSMSVRARDRWFSAYVDDVVSREAIRPLADVRFERELRSMLRLLGARSSAELVLADLSADAELARPTVSNYLAVLEALHLVHLLPAWATNATTRAKKRPKIHLVDTGVAASMNGVGAADVAATADGKMAGALLESFVVTELAKQASFAMRDVDLWHFQDRNGDEVDVIVTDRRSGNVAGIEVKASSSPGAGAANTLGKLRDRLGSRFTVGVVLNTGPNPLPLGERLWAVPISGLWS
jgi:uncharacterized protein